MALGDVAFPSKKYFAAAHFVAYEKISSTAFVNSITDALEPCAALPSPTQFATVFHLPASLKRLSIEPFDNYHNRRPRGKQPQNKTRSMKGGS
jgi:hypothetical protein